MPSVKLYRIFVELPNGREHESIPLTEEDATIFLSTIGKEDPNGLSIPLSAQESLFLPPALVRETAFRVVYYYRKEES